MKLFLVTLRGMNFNATGPNYGTAYVIAEDSDSAYRKVKDFLGTGDIGFDSDRELKSVELIAEDSKYPLCRTILYV